MGISNFKFDDLRMSYAKRCQSCQGPISASGPSLHTAPHYPHRLHSTISSDISYTSILLTSSSTRSPPVLSTISLSKHTYKMGLRRRRFKRCFHTALPPSGSLPHNSFLPRILRFILSFNPHHDFSRRRRLRLGHCQPRRRISPTNSCIFQGRALVSFEDRRRRGDDRIARPISGKARGQSLFRRVGCRHRTSGSRRSSHLRRRRHSSSGEVSEAPGRSHGPEGSEDPTSLPTLSAARLEKGKLRRTLPIAPKPNCMRMHTGLPAPPTTKPAAGSIKTVRNVSA